MLDIFAHILTGDIGGVLEIGNKEKISDFSGVFVFLMLMRFSTETLKGHEKINSYHVGWDTILSGDIIITPGKLLSCPAIKYLVGRHNYHVGQLN